MQNVCMAGLQLRLFYCTRHTLYMHNYVSLVCICNSSSRDLAEPLGSLYTASAIYDRPPATEIHHNTAIHVHVKQYTCTTPIGK